MTAIGRLQTYKLLKLLLDEGLLSTGEPTSARCNLQLFKGQ